MHAEKAKIPRTLPRLKSRQNKKQFYFKKFYDLTKNLTAKIFASAKRFA